MRSLSTFLLLLGAFGLSAQASLTAITANLAKSMQEVEGPKATYSQSVETVEGKPYLLVYQRTTTTGKDKSIDEQWRLNLADIDSKSLRVEDSKDALRINLRVDKGQKYIQYFKDGSLSGYTDNLSIYGQGIDNAREIEGYLLAAVPQAVLEWGKVADMEGKTDEQLLEQLKSLVDDLSLNGTDYRQRLSQMPDYSDRFNLNVVASTSRNNKQETAIWSLGDLKPGAVRLQISGANALVEAITKDNLAWVYMEREGVQQDYAKAVYIRVANPDQGKLLVAVLEKLIPFGEKAIQNRLPIPGKATENFSRITDNLGKFTAGKNAYDVSLTPGCQSRLKEVQGDTRMEYAFHFGDLDPKTVKLEMDDERVEIHISTEKKNDYIWVAKDEAQQNYDDELVLYLSDVETGRLVAHLIPSIIEQCPEEVNFGKFEDVQRWIDEGKAPDSGISQVLSAQSGEEHCKWNYVVRDNDEKKPSESSYEFNSYDLDPDQVKIVVNKKTVGVQVQTLKKQNIISSMEKEKPGYVSTLQFEVADIIAAKSLRISLEKLIAGCK
ncbi:MAG: hypothetical protein IPJ40_02670 [Saprospirales bacterium]|nr:hypothetical protein [Saprospirales bacterium]